MFMAAFNKGYDMREKFDMNLAHSFVVNFKESTHQPVSILGFIDDIGALHIDGETRFGEKWHSWNYAGDKSNYLFSDNLTNKERIQRLKSILKNNTGAVDVIFPEVENHSCGISEKLFELSDSQLWEFIMNPNCMFRGGNDDEGPWMTEDIWI